VNPDITSKPQKWIKCGLLISGEPNQPWAHSHAMFPTVDVIDEDQFDLYYSPRDSYGRGHIACSRIGVAKDGELTVIAHDPTPVLSPGALGAFDDRGVTITSLVRTGDFTIIYYTGWALGVTVPFYVSTGAAIRRFGQSRFERVSAAPLLERCAVDPYLTGGAFARRDGDTWRMWYVSGARWQMVDEKPRHYYHVRYADSDDGFDWRRSGRVLIDFADEHEYAISRPCVLPDKDRYRMWFAARGESYRMGYAESSDGLHWNRYDHLASLRPSASGWDAEMVAYPAVFDINGRRYMLYNGNGYGRSGIGYAVLG
jgi:hypothetical protein